MALGVPLPEKVYGHGWLLQDGGKMSKSKGEFLTVSLLEEKGYDPLAYRYYCLGSHYRNPLTFTWEGLDGAANAYKKLKSKITAYVKEKIFNKQRMFKKSFSRPNRRQGIVKFDGSPLNPGKKKVEQLLLVDLAFYIDKSGSMGNNIENVFDAYENIAMAVTKLCKGNAVVKDINYRTFIFDTQIKEIKFGTRSHSGGNTCEFEDLLTYISKHTKDILVNCIITDADFGVNASESRKFFEELEGLVIVVTNNPNQTLKNLSNETKLKTKFIYIEANSDFSLS